MEKELIHEVENKLVEIVGRSNVYVKAMGKFIHQKRINVLCYKQNRLICVFLPCPQLHLYATG